MVLQLGWVQMYTPSAFPLCELGPDVNTHCVAGLGPNVYTTIYMVSQSYSKMLFPPWQSSWVTVNVREIESS